MNAVDLLSRALPFLHESAQPYEDDGSNEPLELARDIETFLEESAAALSAQAGVVEALQNLAFAADAVIAKERWPDFLELPVREARAALAAVEGVDRG